MNGWVKSVTFDRIELELHQKRNQTTTEGKWAEFRLRERNIFLSRKLAAVWGLGQNT